MVLHPATSLSTFVADIPSRRRLRSSASGALDICPRTVGDGAFPVAASRFWYELPGDVIAAESLTTFHRRLKTFLFYLSFPDFS